MRFHSMVTWLSKYVHFQSYFQFISGSFIYVWSINRIVIANTLIVRALNLGNIDFQWWILEAKFWSYKVEIRSLCIVLTEAEDLNKHDRYLFRTIVEPLVKHHKMFWRSITTSYKIAASLLVTYSLLLGHCELLLIEVVYYFLHSLLSSLYSMCKATWRN